MMFRAFRLARLAHFNNFVSDWHNHRTMPAPETVRPAQSPDRSMEQASAAVPSSLTRLCLARDDDVSTRRLAWINSICVAFLLVGLAGFKSLRPAIRELPKPERFVPVAFTVPASQPAFSAAPKLEFLPTAPNTDAAPDPVAVVAVYSPEIAFPVPVESAVLLAPAPFAASSTVPARADATPEATEFKPGSGTPITPQPEYPALALRRGYEGKVVINFTVDVSGSVGRVELGRSSGFTVLDDAALNVVRNRWRFPPGAVRHHFVEIIFQLK